MHNTELKIYRWHASVPNRDNIRRYLDDHGFVDFNIPGPDEISDAALVCMIPAKGCYQSFTVGVNPNVQQVRNDWMDFFGNILKSRHGSVLSHATFGYIITGLTRVCTAELNRHSIGTALSEMSMRYVRFTDIGWLMPPSLQPEWWWTELNLDELLDIESLYARIKLETEVLCMADCENKESDILSSEMNLLIAKVDTALKSHKEIIFVEEEVVEAEIRSALTRAGFRDAFTGTEKIYNTMVNGIWPDVLNGREFKAKKNITSTIRRIVPIGVSTQAFYTWNIRALRFILEQRVSPEAEEEILWVMTEVGRDIVHSIPELLQDIKDLSGEVHCPEVVRQAILRNDRDFCINTYRKV